jgi:hypothetical protein
MSSETDTPRVGKLGLGTLDAACKMVGGDKPIHPSSYYRGAEKGYYEKPVKVGPNISRVNLDNLAAKLQARFDKQQK